MSQVFKILKGIERIEQESIFIQQQVTQHTKQSSNPWNLTKKLARTDSRWHNVGLRVIDDWNAHPDDVKNLERLNVFKSKLGENERCTERRRQKFEKGRDWMRASQPPDEENVHQFAYLLVIFGL